MEVELDVNKLKVPELKKELKARGLPVTGKRNELVERLQVALAADVGEEEEELDEDAILAGDMEDDDIEKITPLEEEAALTSLAEQQDKKVKVSLKRAAPAGADAATPVATNGVAAHDDAAEASTEDEPKIKLIKFDDLTSDEAKAARAKRFGVPDKPEDPKAARAKRFGLPEANGANRAAKLSTETGGTDLEKLKARAERFGVVTAKALGKLEEKEKLKKRQERFAETEAAAVTASDSTSTTTAASTTASTEPVVSPSGKVVISMSASSDDELKKKRAARFGLAS